MAQPISRVACVRAVSKLPPAGCRGRHRDRCPPPRIAESTKCASCGKNVRYRPARDRYKIFIIDEAHQITTEAFNALLKTIEEPPSWVVFILCTTEAHKISATIASRCQHFSFRSVEFEALIERMGWICKQEGIEADCEALAALAQAGEGSVRDSLSALDQAIACCGSRLDAAQIRTLLGGFSLDSLDRVTQALAASEFGRHAQETVEDLERNLAVTCSISAASWRDTSGICW